MTLHKNVKPDYKRAKDLRRQSPPAEKLLWNALCEQKKPKGLKFRRQYPLHPYIVDFICLKAKLIIELDGMSHDMRQTYDQKRTHYLEKSGYTVLRFSNDDATNNLDGVITTIINKAEELAKNQNIPLLKAPSPNPSRKGRGML